MYSRIKINWFTVFGAMLWIAGGLLLAFRPAGHPPTTFRKTADLMPLLALGLVMIGLFSGCRLLTTQKNSGWLFNTACRSAMFSSLAYALGVFIRQFFLQATGWEPFMPLGFLVFIISWALLGVLSFKKGFLSRPASLFMIASAISLLTFNDQYNPYGAVMFGVLTIFTFLLSPQNQKQDELSKKFEEQK